MIPCAMLSLLRKMGLIFCLLGVAGMMAQNDTGSPEAIKKKIATIRKHTNWDDAGAAKLANDSIKELSKQLTRSYQQQNAPANETPEEKSIREENQAYKQKLIDQLFKTAPKGKHADILLGEPVREEIDEFIRQEEENKDKKSAGYYEQMNFLCLDLSMPGVQKLIEQMDKFKGITTMVVMGGEHPAPLDLKQIFGKAANYPLQQLYIIDFPLAVRQFPQAVIQFPELNLLSLVNNSIPSIPPSIRSLKNLKTLYVDLNPLTTIISSIGGMTQLERLGISKTRIPAEEAASLKKQLPDCQIEAP